MSVVLMYHALYRGEQTQNIDAEDLPYAVSEQRFVEQLDSLDGRTVGVFDGASPTSPDIVITFDDGHVSNLEIAVPHLLQRGMSAYFFVSSDFIDTRPGFCSSSEIKALADAGMVIGAHGKTHRFFDDLDQSEAKHELDHSRTVLESLTGSAVTSMSFPGGRYRNTTLGQVRDAGYTQWFGSDIGMVGVSAFPGSSPANSVVVPLADEASPRGGPAGGSPPATVASGDQRNLLAQQQSSPIQRIAIRRNTPASEFQRIIAPDTAFFRRQRQRSQLKQLARRMLGNRIYHGLYKSISAR